MRRKTERCTLKINVERGNKKMLLHTFAHTKEEKSTLDTTIKHDREMERKRKGAHVKK